MTVDADLTTWTTGFQEGHRRGLIDGAAEDVQRNWRDPQHRGTLPNDDPDWLDGFLEGYGTGWHQSLGGGRHVEP